jgi:hypothetical protein
MRVVEYEGSCWHKERVIGRPGMVDEIYQDGEGMYLKYEMGKPSY